MSEQRQEEKAPATVTCFFCRERLLVLGARTLHENGCNGRPVERPLPSGGYRLPSGGYITYSSYPSDWNGWTS